MISSSDGNLKRYLDLLEKALVNSIYGDAGMQPWGDTGVYDAAQRLDGRDWPSTAHTMIGSVRLNNVRRCVEGVIDKNIPGDCVETGVWRGGASIMMRGVLAAYGIRDRKVWLADSFAGLPPPKPAEYPADAGDQHHLFEQLVVSLESVRDNFEAYDLLDDQVYFIEGFFSETLPTAPIDRIAVLRLDGDMYESTIVALRSLYHKVSPGGYVIVDDYGAIPACAKAVDDFRRENGIVDEFVKIDWTGVFWRKI